jgi:hypothetical protein
MHLLSLFLPSPNPISALGSACALSEAVIDASTPFAIVLKEILHLFTKIEEECAGYFTSEIELGRYGRVERRRGGAREGDGRRDVKWRVEWMLTVPSRGSSTVYLGYSKAHKRTVAVKKVGTDMLSKEEREKGHILREYQVIKSVADHENVSPILNLRIYSELPNSYRVFNFFSEFNLLGIEVFGCF